MHERKAVASHHTAGSSRGVEPAQGGQQRRQKPERGQRGYDAHSGTLRVICTEVVSFRLTYTGTVGTEWD